MLATMQRSGADFTNTFRSLSRIDPPTTDEGCVVRPQTFDPVLEYILAQSASLEAMRKKSVAAFHPQARASTLTCPPSPAKPTTTSLSPPATPAHHRHLPPSPAGAPAAAAHRREGPVQTLGVRAGRLRRRARGDARRPQFWRNSAQSCAIILRRLLRPR